MVCPYCGGKTQVFNSRSQKRTNSTWRRRKCLACSSLFTTEEKYELLTVLRVQAKKGNLEPFNTPKLLISIYECCKHLKRPEETAHMLTETALKDLVSLQKPTVTIHDITSVTHYILKCYDKVASIQYRAFHPN